MFNFVKRWIIIILFIYSIIFVLSGFALAGQLHAAARDANLAINTIMTEAQDYLEPCSVVLQEYENRLEKIVLGAMPGTVNFWVTVMPAFHPESSVGISTEKGQHFLSHVVLGQSLWYSSWVKTGPNTMKIDLSVANIQPKTKSTRISSELYSALRSEWERSIKGARPSEITGVDGVIFNFKLSGQCARAWSPDPETRNGKLVALVSALSDLVDKEHENPTATSEEPVLKLLRELPPP